MLNVPEPTLPMLRWGEQRQPDGGKRGRARAREYERSQDKPQVREACIAQPCRYDVLRAPKYTPPAAAAVRAGADDFLRVASRGVRC
ncbi:hypothetical protein D3C72_1526610 [compost metagenome]